MSNMKVYYSYCPECKEVYVENANYTPDPKKSASCDSCLGELFEDEAFIDYTYGAAEEQTWDHPGYPASAEDLIATDTANPHLSPFDLNMINYVISKNYEMFECMAIEDYESSLEDY